MKELGNLGEQSMASGLLFRLLTEILLLLWGGILVTLVLRDEAVHVALSVCELHHIHVPVEEVLLMEHNSQLF